jgi:adenylate cyclase, class 2
VEHAGSPIENEIKLRVPGPAEAMQLLEDHGFRLIRSREFESNEVYDTPDGRLRARGELIRLRTSGGLSFLTFKAPELPGPHKRREELETRVDNADAMRGIIERLGFQILFRYEKYRSEHQRENETGIATLDETPVGTFLELEGSAEWVDGVAAELGFSRSDYILASYGKLYLEFCTQHGHHPSHMVFGNGITDRPR